MSPTPRLSAGQRDHLVTLVAITDSSGSSGFPVETDAPEASGINLFASRDELDARERFMAAQLTAPYDTRWQLPYRPDIDPDVVAVTKTFALLHRGRRYDIIDAKKLGRADGVELLTMARHG